MKGDYLTLVKTNPIAIGFECGFCDLTEIHNGWIKSLLFSEDDTTIQAHRGSYKTSVFALCLSLLIILRPTKSLGFFRKTDPDAKTVIRLVSKLLKTNVFKLLVKRLYNCEFTLTEDTSNNITTNLFIATSGASQLEGRGIESSITGRHYDYVFTDDIVTRDDRYSRAVREFTKTVYMELQNIKNRGGRIINTGTPWHKDDAFCLMPPAQKYDCYSTGLISKEILENLRSSMTASLFAANYELRHIASEDVIFTEPKFTSEEYRIYDGLCHVDASYGGNDRTAFTICKKQSDGSFTVFGKLWNKHVDKCMDEIILLIKTYRAGTLYLESNADKGYLAREFEKYNVPVQTYHEKTNKFVKISTHLKGAWGRLFFLEQTDKEYVNDVTDYNEQAEHDDAPDSCASLLREMEREVEWGW